MSMQDTIRKAFSNRNDSKSWMLIYLHHSGVESLRNGPKDRLQVLVEADYGVFDLALKLPHS